MKNELLNAVELVGESTVKLPVKYLNGDNICVMVTNNGDSCSVSDKAGLYESLGDEAKAKFTSYIDNWRVEFDEIKVEDNALIVENIPLDYVVNAICSFASALLLINDFAERGEYRKEYFLCH